jgi:hypothetical protein
MTRTRKTLLAVTLPLLVAAAPVGGVAVTAAVEEGCGATLPSPTPILGSLPPLGICVVQAAIGDIVEAISDPASLISAILAACSQYGTATVEQIIAWIEQALAGAPGLDGGSVALNKARLNKVHAAALVMQHVVIPPSASVSAPPAPAPAAK